jgi:hypothetical protein
VGRTFPSVPTMMRVTIGTDSDMAKFRKVLSEVMGA